MRALCLVLALAALPVFAASNKEEGVAFSVTPWFHFGWSWVAYAPDKGVERTGKAVELNLQPALLLPGGVLAVGVAAGYYGTGGATAAAPSDFLDLTGLQVLPIVMVNIGNAFSVYAKGGYVFGSFNYGDAGAGAFRVGGGLMANVLEVGITTFALSIDVMHSRLVAVEGLDPVPDYAVTSAQLGLCVSFDPDD